MKKVCLALLLILTSSLQAMNTTNNLATVATSHPNAGAPATHTAVTGSQEINATATTTPQFKFHFGTPSLVRKAAAKTTPEAAEEAYQAQLTRQDQIQNQIQEAEKAGDTKKVAELKKQQNFIPWPILEEAQDVPKDVNEKIENALRKDNSDLLKMAMEERKIDPITNKLLFYLETEIPLLKAITLDRFTKVAKNAINFNALKSLNFLLSHAKNIPLTTLNKLLTYADAKEASAEILRLIVNRVMEDTNHRPHGEFFDTWNQFPLHKAIVENRALEVAKLIDDKADVNMVAHDMTPLLLACKYGTDEISYKITKLLIENGADVNAQDNKKRTPLMYASKNDHTAIAQLLIKKGADVNTKDHFGQTPLMYASRNGHTAVAQLLIENGAQVEAQSNNGLTPLMYASDNGNTATVQLLIEKGAKVEGRDDENWTPLIFASRAGHTDVVQLLIKNSAEVNARDSEKWTPLLLASKRGHTAVVQLLIKNSAEINVKIKEGDTPLHIATKFKKPALVQILLDAGADDTITDIHGKTALQIAVEKGYKELVDILKPKFTTISNTVDDESDSESE